MIIVIPNDSVVHRNHPEHTELTFKLFEAETSATRHSAGRARVYVFRGPLGRALSGASMGGRHTMFVGFNSLDLFASFGAQRR